MPAPHRIQTVPSRIEHWRHLTEICALVIAAAWGFYVFAYQEIIKPAHEESNVAITASLTRQPAGKAATFVDVDLKLRNGGPGSVKLVLYGIRIWGRRIGTAYALRRTSSDGASGFDGTLSLSTPQLLRSIVVPFHPLLGSRTGKDLEIPADQVQHLKLTFVLPKDRFDVLTVSHCVAFTRAGDTRRYPVAIVPAAQGTSSFVKRPLDSGVGFYCNDDDFPL